MDSLVLGLLAIQLNLAKLSLQQMQPIAIAATLQPEDYKTYASTTAEKLGIDPDVFTNVLQCESHFRPDAPGDFSTTTKQYTSFGIAQIHLIAHPDVTKAQALDGIWSIDWAAQQFAKGNAHWWSCYKLLGYDST